MADSESNFESRVLEAFRDLREELGATKTEVLKLNTRFDGLERQVEEIRTDLSNITRTHGAVLSMLSAFDDRQTRADEQYKDLMRRVERLERPQ